MDDRQERELVRQCLRHDRRAWEGFVDRYAGYIHSVILQGLKAARFRFNHEDADDIFSEVFLSLVEKDFHLLRSFEWRCSLKTWLWAVTRKKVLRHFRKKGIKTMPLTALDPRQEAGPGGPVSLVSSEPDPKDAARNAELRSILEETMQEMSERDRLCLALFYFDGLSYQEISKVTGLPPGNVGVQIHRAKKRMETRLREKGMDDA